MANVPKYTPQVGTPNTRIAGAQGRGYEPFRLNLDGFGDIAGYIAEKRDEIETNDLNAQLAAEEPRAQLRIAQAVDEIKRTWTPDSDPVADQISRAIDGVRDEAVGRYRDPRAQKALASRADQYRERYMLDGFTWESGRRVDLRVSTYEEGYRALGVAGANDPQGFARQLAQLNQTVQADTQLPQSAKAEFIQKQSREAALSVARARAEFDPEGALAYTNAMLGAKEPVYVGSSGQGGGDIVAEIVKRESNNRMYGAGGEVLRGPPIRTASGATIHAYGPYQLLESTAREQARKLGIEWNPDLFFRKQSGDPRADAEARQYHDTLGQAYIRDQVQEFGGDPVVVAAAHNMGPEAARGWAAGRPYQTQSGKWWYPSGPKDLAAMPEETRKYVQGLGVEERVVQRPAPTEADPDDEAGLPFRLLDADSLMQVRSLAQSNLAERNRQRQAELSIQRDLFKQRIEDIEVAAKRGDSFEMPSDSELVTFLGQGDAALTKQRLANYQNMAGALRQLPGLSNGELEAAAKMPDPEGTEDRENRQFVRDTVAGRAQQLLASRKSDPGQAALDQSPSVKGAYGQWAEAASAFYTAGDGATQDQFAAMANAQANFVRTSFAQQRQWGVDQPRLPKKIVEQMAAGFAVQMKRDPAQAAAYIARLPDLLGNEDAVAEVANKIGPLGWLAMDGVPGQTLATLQRASEVQESERMRGLPEGTTKADLARQVNTVFQPLFDTLAQQQDSVTIERYRSAAMALTVDRMSRGATADDAAKQAYAELFGDRNAVNGTYRVDTTKYDPQAVSIGLTNILNAFPADGLLVQPEPGFTLEESQQRKLRTVRQRAYWVNTGDGTGVYLMHDNGPVLNRNGAPIKIRFDVAGGKAGAAVADPEAGRTDYRRARGF